MMPRSTDRIRTDKIRAAKEAAILELSEGTKREIAKLELEIESNPLASSQIHMLKSQDTAWNEIRDIRSDLVYVVGVVQKVESENKTLGESTRAFGFLNPAAKFKAIAGTFGRHKMALAALAIVMIGLALWTGTLYKEVTELQGKYGHQNQ